jgi:hypothetical protein
MSTDAGSRRAILAAALLSCTLVLAASAACPGTNLEVPWANVTIDNPGALEPGTGVVMSVRIDFPDKENTTYPVTSQLELTSGLDDPAWTWNIVRQGIKRPEVEDRKSRVVIGGGDLSYAANTSESLEIHLYGTAPSVTENKNLTVMRVIDVSSSACIDEVYRYNAWVLNTTITRERIAGLYADLAQLRTDAAAKQQGGADTTGVMEKIGEAQQSLDEANSTPVSEFVSVSMALNRTEAVLADGRRMVEEAGVTGTTIPVQESTGETAGQTPASPVSAALPALAILATGYFITLVRRKEK